MKKLSLKKLNLEEKDLLQRNQLKIVFGGYGGYDVAECSAKCSSTCTITCKAPGTCKSSNGSNGYCTAGSGESKVSLKCSNDCD